MKLKTLIIDDEPLARKRVTNLLEDVPEIKIISQCKTGQEAIKKIEEVDPDLLFLDIQLKDMTGFDVLDSIDSNKRPVVIFITAYDKFALKAFDFFAFDYILKPFKDERFYKSTLNVIHHLKNGDLDGFDEKINNLLDFMKNPVVDNLNASKRVKNKLAIKLGNKINFINTNEIKYISASGYYAEIHTEEKKHLLRVSLSSLIEALDAELFIRIHRSTIINLSYLSGLIYSSYGEIDVKMKDEQLFRISKSYKKDFLSKMGV